MRETLKERALYRWINFLHFLQATANYLVETFDTCHLCGETADQWCVGCHKRICIEHESGYYQDENLCTLCRSEITPEEEAEDKAADEKEEAEADGCPLCGLTREHTHQM